MSRCNRVQPTGQIIAHPGRGMFMGNRGILHDAQGRLGARRWAGHGWVTCALSFKGRAQAINAPGHYTQLFFHDEAVAFAAGHRPCAECRRADYLRFRAAGAIIGPIAGFDRVLHAIRALPRPPRQRRHQSDLSSLPDGAFILGDDARAMLVWGDALLPFAPQVYCAPETRPRSGQVTVLTPEPILATFRGGYRPITAFDA